MSGKQLKCVGEQGVASEDCGGFIELDVASGAASSQWRVVHGRQIVVDQRVSVEAFDCYGSGNRVSGTIEAFASGEDKSRSNSFPPRGEAVPHSLVDARRHSILRR